MILIIKHISIEGPGIIGEFFRNSQWQVETIELGNGERLPSDFNNVEAIIVLGGPMNANEEDRFPFLKEEDIFIKKAIKKEIPILGICLGAQLLAKACGAKVRKAKKKEIGWYKISLTAEGKKDRLFQGLDSKLDVFQWHEDTFELPANTGLLATSIICKNQAFRFSRNAYGLQFHIEVTPDMIKSWIKEYVDDEGSRIVDIQKMFLDTDDKKRKFIKQSNKLLSNFSQLITDEISIIG
jgi:GMP synthase-like glutamine amidotransferase